MFRTIAVALALCLSVPSLHAALIDRGGGMIYDTDRDITWLADANYFGSTVDWETAMLLVANLEYGGHSDWRLPRTLLNDPTCRFPDDSAGVGCRGSELGHLFYEEIGVNGQTTNIYICGSHGPNFDLFTNIHCGFYWSETTMGTGAYHFFFSNGAQAGSHKGTPNWVWAVHDGDIANVPNPPAVWLFGSALGVMGWMRRKAIA